MNSETREQIKLFAKVTGPFLLIGVAGFGTWFNYKFITDTKFRGDISFGSLLQYDLFLIGSFAFVWITLRKAWKNEL